MIHVLICTESGILAMSLRHTLERAGYAVIGPAWDGATAMTLAQACRPDLVLMDTDLRDGDGLQAAREITDQSWCPIILLSDYPLKADACGAFPEGVYDYLQKPFAGHQLVQMVDRVGVLIQIVKEEFQSAIPGRYPAQPSASQGSRKGRIRRNRSTRMKRSRRTAIREL